MKTYDLWLHFKQGDDFSRCLGDTKSIGEAFELWAEEFKEHERICRQLAVAFEKIGSEDIDIDAQVHHIGFHPKTNKGREFLNMLTKEELINEEGLDDLEDETDPSGSDSDPEGK